MPLERAGYVLEYAPGRDLDGRPALVVVVKRTYDIDPVEARCTPAAKQEPPLLGDKLFSGDDPTKSSIRFEGELLPYKRLVDVIVHGTAYAPGGRKARTFEVAARVGRIKRTLRIVGPRKAVWQPPQEEKHEGKKILVPRPPIFTEPQPIDKVPLRYENAYGGESLFIPPDLDAYRALVDEQKQAAEKKKTDDEKAAADKKAAEYKKKKDLALDEFMADRPIEDRFSKSALTEGAEPAGMLTEGGTRILSKEEIERAHAAELQRQKQIEAEEAAQQPQRDAIGVIESKAVLGLDDYQAPERPRSEDDDDRGTKVLNIAEMGDVVEADGDWVDGQMKAKAELEGAVGERPKRVLPDDLPRLFCPSNPVGKGFAVGNHPETIDGLELPLIEDPERPLSPLDLVREPERLMDVEAPVSAGFGVVGKGWYPRARHAGVPPEELENVQDRIDEMVCGLDPEDPKQRTMLENTLDYAPPVFSDRWFNGAPEPLQLSHLYGDEEVTLTNLTKDGTLYVRLPGNLPWVTCDRGRGREVVRVRIDTLVVLADELQVVLIWRGHLPYSGPDELAEYPRLDFDIVDRSIGEQREADFHEAEQEALRKKDGVTQIIDLEQIRKLDAEEQAKLAKDAAGPSGPKYLWTIEDEHGTRVEKLTEAGDVLHTDEGWVEKARVAADHREANEAFAAELGEREKRRLKKGELRKKLEEIKQREAEEAALLAKKKK